MAQQKPARAAAAQLRGHGTFLLLAGALLALLPHALVAAALTDPGDKAALLSFKQGLGVPAAALSTWDESSDPCSDGWAGVMCLCSQISAATVVGCVDDGGAITNGTGSNTAALKRVKALDLGPLTVGSQPLRGGVSSALGNLTELLLLDLSQNQLTGTLPATLASLSKLQLLSLNGNQLSGAPPAFLGVLSSLNVAQLSSNHLEGPLPQQWCGNNATYAVDGNALLCGIVPTCLEQHGINGSAAIGGTFLLPSSNLSLQTGGYCDATPPECDLDVGCRVTAPPYLTSPRAVSFNFTGFVDADSGPLSFSWGIGTAPGLADVLAPIPFAGTDAIRMVRLRDATDKPMRWYSVVHDMGALALTEGLRYFVTVVATNRAGPRLSANITSTAVIVDSTPPVPGAVYNTDTWQQHATTSAVRHLGASWDQFTDVQSGVAAYFVQFFAQDRSPTANRTVNGTGPGPDATPWGTPGASDSGSGGGADAAVATAGGTVAGERNLTELVPVGLANRIRYPVRGLNNSMQYFVRVTAVNRAGLNTTVAGLPIRVDTSSGTNLGPAAMALAVTLVSFACLGVGAGLALLISRARTAQQRRREKERAMETKQVKALMYALMATPGDPEGCAAAAAAAGGGSFTSGIHPVGRPTTYEQLKEAEDFAFVVTDIENSTELSQQDPIAFPQMQEIHDSVMREGIARHGGYEIITEGDSFSIAFTSVATAANFCLDVQYRLLETSWPSRVLRLRSCRTIRGPNGEPIFRGPRVRMGLHWAKRGTVVHRLHHITRHRVFAGPGMQCAQEIGDAANGGQVVLTHNAWEELSHQMAAAHWPVVHLLGLFHLPSSPCPVWLYQLTEAIGKPLGRSFDPPRKIKMEWPEANVQMPPAWRLKICSPPRLAYGGTLAFVICRFTSVPPGAPRLPPAVQARFEEIALMQAQQFRGYAFDADPDNARNQSLVGLAFSDTRDAMRFCHAAQMLYMYSSWPSESDDFSGVSVPSPDGRWVFQGPRIAMSIHTDSKFEGIQISTLKGMLSPQDHVRLGGHAVDFAVSLSAAARGGQVVLSEQAWESIKPAVTQHPGAVQVISLGRHVLSFEYPDPVLLMEVMPNLLSRRVFKKPHTLRMVEPGYRDAPELGKPMAIVFCKCIKPQDVEVAEQPQGKYNPRLIALYQAVVLMYTSMARRLLRQYDGYECKEPEPGKFTLTFKRLDNALLWACRLQAELLHLPWPDELMALPDCAPTRGACGEVLYRGLRVRIGIAWGYAASKKPLNTGRADYFGVLANVAARVMGLAFPGQVLFELSERPSYDSAGVPPIPEGRSGRIPAVGWPAAPHLIEQVHLAQGLMRPCHLTGAASGSAPPSGGAPGAGGDAFRLAAGAFSGAGEIEAANAESRAVPFERRLSEVRLGADEDDLAAWAVEEEGDLPLFVTLYCRGQFQIRGLDQPRVVYEAVAPGLERRVREIPVPIPMHDPSPSARSAASSTARGVRQRIESWVGERSKGSWLLPRVMSGGRAGAGSVSSGAPSPGAGVPTVHAYAASSGGSSHGGSNWRGGGARAPPALDGASPSPRCLSFGDPGDLRFGGRAGGGGAGGSITAASAAAARQLSFGASPSRASSGAIQSARGSGGGVTWGPAAAAAESPTASGRGVDGVGVHSGSQAACVDGAASHGLRQSSGVWSHHHHSGGPGPGPSALRMGSGSRLGSGGGSGGIQRPQQAHGVFARSASGGLEEGEDAGFGAGSVVHDPFMGPLQLHPIRTGSANPAAGGGHQVQQRDPRIGEGETSDGATGSEAGTPAPAAVGARGSTSGGAAGGVGGLVTGRGGSFISLRRQGSGVSYASRDGGHSPGPAYMNNSFTMAVTGGDDGTRQRDGPFSLFRRFGRSGRGPHAPSAAVVDSPTMLSPRGPPEAVGPVSQAVTGAGVVLPDPALLETDQAGYIQSLVDCYSYMRGAEQGAALVDGAAGSAHGTAGRNCREALPPSDIHQQGQQAGISSPSQQQQQQHAAAAAASAYRASPLGYPGGSGSRGGSRAASPVPAAAGTDAFGGRRMSASPSPASPRHTLLGQAVGGAGAPQQASSVADRGSGNGSSMAAPNAATGSSPASPSGSFTGSLHAADGPPIGRAASAGPLRLTGGRAAAVLPRASSPESGAVRRLSGASEARRQGGAAASVSGLGSPGLAAKEQWLGSPRGQSPARSGHHQQFSSSSPAGGSSPDRARDPTPPRPPTPHSGSEGRASPQHGWERGASPRHSRSRSRSRSCSPPLRGKAGAGAGPMAEGSLALVKESGGGIQPAGEAGCGWRTSSEDEGGFGPPELSVLEQSIPEMAALEAAAERQAAATGEDSGTAGNV